MQRLAFAAAVALVAWAPAQLAHAQRSIDGLLTVESFDGYLGNGLEPTPQAGRLDSDEWRITGMSEGTCAFGGTCNAVDSDFTRGDDPDTVSEGGLYSFIVTPGNETFGVQPVVDDMTPGTITWRLTNNTGATINAVSLEYSLWVRNDQLRSTSIDVAYSLDDITYVPLAGLSTSTDEAPDDPAAWEMTRLQVSVPTMGLTDGGALYLQWSTDDLAGTQNRDQIAIDDITIRMAGCGSGEVEVGEDCDDGNDDDGDGCDSNCDEEPGWVCTGTLPTVCTDVDECADALDNCDVNAECIDADGSFSCACLEGYSGDGVTCTDIDECTDELDDCDVNAQCDNTGGSFTCTCDDGYEGDGTVCADVDECEEGSDDCDANAECVNEVGGYVCNCDPGYAGDGTDCSDVDECEEGTDDCDANASCSNTAGGFECTCDDGFDGNGQQCDDLDEDGDGILRDDDNCPRDANPEQEDADDDGFGDACDNSTEGGDGGGGGCGCRAGAAPTPLGGLLLVALALLSGRRKRRPGDRTARRTSSRPSQASTRPSPSRRPPAR